MHIANHYTLNSNITCAFCHRIVGNFRKGPDKVTNKSKLKVAPLKNLLFLAVLKLDVKDSCGYNKEIESLEKTFPII